MESNLNIQPPFWLKSKVLPTIDQKITHILIILSSFIHHATKQQSHYFQKQNLPQNKYQKLIKISSLIYLCSNNSLIPQIMCLSLIYFIFFIFLKQFLFKQIKIMIKTVQIIEIDESVRLEHWNNQFPFQKIQSSKEFFNKYSQVNKNNKTYQYSEEQYIQDQSQNKAIESGFRKLKNEQIEKLKDLKSQYEEIRKITTDYAAPRGSKTPSMRSSSDSQSQSGAIVSPKHNQKQTSGREVQILQLEKKQLEIMFQNSMKKIQELLHNEMQYKKMIHELKLQKEAKSYGQTDGEVVLKSFKRRQKDNSDKLKVFQLQKESFISTINTNRDKIKYLESYLTNSQQELKKILQEKRNYEELIRLEKDKYMNLEIQFRREKRQHEIFEKDKHAEINRLLKLKDLKETNTEKELKNSVSYLQEELKIKEERYTLLLQKFESYQKEKIREQKDVEIKIFHELMSKSQSQEPQNKFLQQTMTHILGRLTNLQNKPMEIESPVKSQEEFNPFSNYQLQFKKYQSQIGTLNEQLDEKKRKIVQQETEIHELNLTNEKSERQRKRLEEIELYLSEELQRLRKNQKLLKRQKSSTINKIYESKVQSKVSNENLYVPTQSITITSTTEVTRNYENKLSILSHEKQQIIKIKKLLQQENYDLKLKISRLQFEVQKAKEQQKFNSSILKQNFANDLDNRVKFEETLKAENNNLKLQINALKRQLQSLLILKDTEINKQRLIIQNHGRMISPINLDRLQSQSNAKMLQLNQTTQSLRVENSTLKFERKEYQSMSIENERILDLLRKTRVINGETDRLWQLKEAQYQKVNSLLMSGNK